MGVSKNEGGKEEGGGTTTRSMGESEEALWGKGITPKRSSDEHGRMDDEMGDGYPYGV